ncbi:MAG TPA: LptF/LptG family permease [Opitutaceae bacterium]|nr:LptF/LptG family permease [Opitutaceae bacterium]
MASRWICATIGHSFVNLLDRYIFKSVLATCTAAVAVFAFVLIVGNVIKDLLNYFLTGQIDAVTFTRLSLMLVPFVVSFALPMGVLTGVLLTLGRLSADSEITAMRAAGLSLRRVARPVILLGLLGGFLALYINFEAMPAARMQYNRERAEALRAKPLSLIVPRTFIRDFPGVTVYVSEKLSNQQGDVLKDIWLWELDAKGRVIRFARADSGRVSYDEENNALVLTLLSGRVEKRDEQAPENFATPTLVGSFEKWEAVRFPLDRMFRDSGVRTKLDWMPLQALLTERNGLTRPVAGETTAQGDERRSKIDKIDFAVSDRTNMALAVFTFALIGVPLGVKVSRRETSANLGLALGLALGYYFFTTAVSWLDHHPEYRPELLLFAPNLILFGLAVILYSRLEKR